MLLTHIQEGKLRALAVMTDRRWPELPDTPTMNELGITGFPSEILFGLLAPAGTPPAIVDKLNRALGEGLGSAETRVSVTKLGMAVRVGTQQQFAADLQLQARQWQAVVEAIGFKSE